MVKKTIPNKTGELKMRTMGETPIQGRRLAFPRRVRNGAGIWEQSSYRDMGRVGYRGYKKKGGNKECEQ